MRSSVFFPLGCILISASVWAQVEIDKQLSFTGTGIDGSITGIQQVPDASSAVNAGSIQQGSLVYAASSGGSNSFALNLSPAIAAYQAGMVFNFLSGQSNTGPATLNVNGLGDVNIKKYVNQDLVGCEIQNGQFVTVAYDGINFQIISVMFPGSPASIPVASTATGISQTQFTANWSVASGATDYYLDVSTSNTFSSFIGSYNNLNVGNVLTLGITGLSCGNTYYYRVRANNNCGPTSDSNVITAVTNACCGSPFTISHTAGSVAPVNKTVTYGTVSTNLSGSTKCWITQNLGADNQASSATDVTEASAGWYWQFNRTQGFKHDGSSRTPSTTWINSINENSDWSAANDPCTLLLGSSWRMPTAVEWTNVDGPPQNWNTLANAFASVLKLHAAGTLSNSTGALGLRGSGGTQNSSSQGTSVNSNSFGYNNVFCDMDSSNPKATGFSLRCLRD